MGAGVKCDAQRQCGASLTLFERVGAGVKCDAQRQRGASLTLFERMAAEVRRDAQRQCGATLTLFEGVGAGVKCDAQRQRGATCGRVDVVHGTATGGAPAVRQVDVRHAVQAALGIIHGGQGWKRTKRTKLTQQIFYCTSRIVFYVCSIPANTNHLCDICIMLDQRRRRLGRRHTNTGSLCSLGCIYTLYDCHGYADYTAIDGSTSYFERALVLTKRAANLDSNSY